MDLTNNIAVIAKIPALPGKRDELVAGLQTALANVESESGTLTYILHLDTKDEDVVWFYEYYSDEAAFAAHGSSEGMKAVGAALRNVAGGRPELTILKPVGGKGVPS
jgi:quinol monooxygenase YgiN